MVNCICLLWEAQFSEAVYVLAVHKVCCSVTLELLSLLTFLTPLILQTLLILQTSSILLTPSVLQTLLTLLIVSRSKTSKGTSTPQLSEPLVHSGRQESVGEQSYVHVISLASQTQPTPARYAPVGRSL